MATFSSDIRRSLRPAVAWTSVALGVPAVGLALIVVGFFYFSDSARPPSSVADEQIPATATAAGAISALDCVHAGAKGCDGFDDAKAYLSSLSGGAPITARIDRADNSGFASVTPSDDDAAWQSFAATATVDGQARPTVVPDAEFQEVRAGVVEFHVPSSDAEPTSWVGRMSFSSDGEQIRLTEITYVAGSGG